MCEVAALLVEVSVDVVVSSELSRSATNVKPTVQLWNRIYLEVAVELLILERNARSFLSRIAGAIRPPIQVGESELVPDKLARSRGLSILNANGAVYIQAYTPKSNEG